jgi:hypothetical protein
VKQSHQPPDDQPTVHRQKDNGQNGIYLCQIDETVSCGACCGLYNLADASRQTLNELLSERTDTFISLPRDMNAILDFGRKIETQTFTGRPFPDFHHCPYIGLIGSEKSRVGCLLHPLNSINRGIDYRGLSYYGGLACAVYFCPSSRLLSPALKTMIIEAVDDWYDYGLVITEEKLIRRFISRIENTLGRCLTEKDLRQNSRYPEILKTFLTLKQNWPYRRRPDAGPCNYFFNDNRYHKPPVDYKTIPKTSPYDDIFRELMSAFDSPESLKAAENFIRDLIDRLAGAFHP